MAIKKPELPLSVGRFLNFSSGRMNALCQKLLDPYELSLPQWVVLSCLWRERELTVGALSDLVGTGLPATSRIVDRMVDRGLVLRRKHETDGRIMVVQLADKGNELRHLSDLHERVNAALFKGFTTEDRERTFDLLRRMQENAEKALEEPSA